MTKTDTSVAESQKVVYNEEMTDVVYTADAGYYFLEGYSVAAVNGISVRRDSYTQITVTGKPTADAAITLTAPTAKTNQTAPTGLTATKASSDTATDGTIGSVTDAMEYQKDGASTWTAVGNNKTEITGLIAGTYKVRYAGTSDKNASPVTTVEVGVKANCTPATVTANNRTYDGTDKPLVTVDESKFVGGEMQYAVTTENKAPTDEKLYSTSIPSATNAGT